jgi:outer membrane protein TolC
MGKIKYAGLFTLLIFIGKSFAQDTENISLAMLIEKAFQQNPQIEIARQRYEATKAKIPQAASLEDPQFEYKYDKMTASMDAVMQGKTGPMRTFGISQEIPFPTKLILRTQIAVKESQMAYEDYKEKEKDIISQVKRLYAELALIYKSIEITQENKVLLEQLAKTASTQYSLGKVSQQDALKAQLEIAKMDNELIMLEQRRQVTQAKLNVLLNQEPSTELGRPEFIEETDYNFDLVNLNRVSKENRSELRSFRLSVERARKIYSLAKQEYLPNFMVKYERMERDSDLTDWAGMVGMTLPLWFWQKQNFNVKEMQKELKAMESEFKNKENMVLLEVKDAFSNVEALKKLAILFKTAYLPQAEQTLKSSLIGYEANQIDFLNLLDSQRMLLEFKLDYFKALVDLEISLAELERAVGTHLERSGGQ